MIRISTAIASTRPSNQFSKQFSKQFHAYELVMHAFEPRSRGLPRRVTSPAVLRLGQQRRNFDSPLQRAYLLLALAGAKAVMVSTLKRACMVIAQPDPALKALVY
jgi:hypothetical protein